ncbi:unnamed protein product [Xylocopa violacea]|uniref:Odorant receptor n=1 Tax=Xylocopa violacea TaxID=135666 RepID=A0ABP1NHY8_XYLVO
MDVERVDLKYVIGWNYYTMKFMGMWPEERKWNRPFSYLILVPCLMMLCFVCAPQSSNLFVIWGDFNLVIENLSLGNITITISLLKTIAFWINGRSLKSLLNCMAYDWETVTKKTDREVMENIGRFTRKTVIRSTLMCHAVVIIYVSTRYFVAKYTEKGLLFRSYFPYNTDVSPNYELTVFAQVVATFYAAGTYTAVDTFVAMLILHVCGQLSNLRDELKTLQTYDKEAFAVKLGQIVRKHDYLNRFMLGCTAQLCFQCFQAIMSLGVETKEYLILHIFFMLFYVIYVMLQLYLYCYVGERLLIESIEMANAAYDAEWYKLSPKNARLLIIIICRSRLPLQITAGRFCSFTMMLYFQILKTSMGYVSVLYATKNK